MFEKAILGYVIATEVPAGTGITGKKIDKLERLGFKIPKKFKDNFTKEEFESEFAGKERQIGIFAVGPDPSATKLHYGALVLDLDGKFMWLPTEAIRIDISSLPGEFSKLYKKIKKHQEQFVLEEEKTKE